MTTPIAQSSAPTVVANMAYRTPAATRPAAPVADATPAQFIAQHRIHLKDSSLFVNGTLVLHPGELNPANEATLRAKLIRNFALPYPAFFADKQGQIARTLGSLIPLSAEAKRAQLLQQITHFNQEVEQGKDLPLEMAFHQKTKPFQAIQAQVTQHAAPGPLALAQDENALALYLLLREKLTRSGHLKPVAEYVNRLQVAESMLADLAAPLGVAPDQFREAALRGGLEGVGHLLGLDPAFVAETKAFAHHAGQQGFGEQLIRNWQLGRQLTPVNTPLTEKIRVGTEARMTGEIAAWRAKLQERYTLPADQLQEEGRVARCLDALAPIQRALMHRLGYEICYTPEGRADSIAFTPNVFGVNKHMADFGAPQDGSYLIYFSSHNHDTKASLRTFVHEVAHNLWPQFFSPQDAAAIDQLVSSDAKRFANFQRMLDQHFPQFEQLLTAYQQGDAAGKAQALATANQQFAAYGFEAEKLFPYLHQAREFEFAVRFANQSLQLDGDRYNSSGGSYNHPGSRFREVLSRFAELKQVEYVNQPEFLNYLAPGLNQLWEKHYLPHLVTVYRQVQQGQAPALQANTPAAQVDAGSLQYEAPLAQETCASRA